MHIDWRFNRDSTVDANNSADNCRHYEKKTLHTNDDVLCKSKRDKESDVLRRFYIILQSNSIEANRIEYGNFALADISSFNSHFGNIEVH